jgi:hypothetical protein
MMNSYRVLKSKLQDICKNPTCPKELIDSFNFIENFVITANEIMNKSTI